MRIETIENNRGNEQNSSQNRNNITVKAVSSGASGRSRDINDTVRAWFNNRMMILLMYIQYVRRLDTRNMLKSVFFLEEIEHHFIEGGAPYPIRNAFRYLKRYLTVYPRVTKKHCERAYEMVARIYAGMGYELRCKPSFGSFKSETRETIRRSAREIFAPALYAVA